MKKQILNNCKHIWKTVQTKLFRRWCYLVISCQDPFIINSTLSYPHICYTFIVLLTFGLPLNIFL